MKTEPRFHDVLRGARMVASIVTIVASAWLASEVVTQDPPTQDPPGKDPSTMCQFHDHPDVGPCDKTKGYMWEGTSWLDDGCYSEIEGCCGAAAVTLMIPPPRYRPLLALWLARSSAENPQ